MTVTGVFRSGKGARMTVNGVFLKNSKFIITESGDDLDTTNFECWTDANGSSGSGGGRTFSQGLIGVENADIDGSGSWDFSENPRETPNLNVSDDGPPMSLIQNRLDNDPWVFDATRILSVVCNVDVKGVIDFNFKAKNQGAWSRPSASFDA